MSSTLNNNPVARLPDYPFEKFDAGKELDALVTTMAQLRTKRNFGAAEAVCGVSRRMLIAIEEEAWALGANSRLSMQHRRQAVALLGEVGEYREAVLENSSPDARDKAARFFANIAARRTELAAKA
jgi:hypothetical protein